MTFEDQPQQSRNQYNDSLGTLGRINTILYKIDGASQRLEISEWYHWLIRLYQELSVHMPKSKRPYFLSAMGDINLDFLTPYIWNGSKVVLSHTLYLKLLQFEQDLRDIWHDSGLDMKQINIDTLDQI